MVNFSNPIRQPYSISTVGWPDNGPDYADPKPRVWVDVRIGFRVCGTAGVHYIGGSSPSYMGPHSHLCLYNLSGPTAQQAHIRTLLPTTYLVQPAYIHIQSQHHLIQATSLSVPPRPVPPPHPPPHPTNINPSCHPSSSP